MGLFSSSKNTVQVDGTTTVNATVNPEIGIATTIDTSGLGAAFDGNNERTIGFLGDALSQAGLGIKAIAINGAVIGVATILAVQILRT